MMLWTYCREPKEPIVHQGTIVLIGYPSKEFQETFIQTTEYLATIEGLSIFNKLHVTYTKDVIKNIDQCKQCKWGLRVALGKCQGKHFFTELTK